MIDALECRRLLSTTFSAEVGHFAQGTNSVPLFTNQAYAHVAYRRGNVVRIDNLNVDMSREFGEVDDEALMGRWDRQGSIHSVDKKSKIAIFRNGEFWTDNNGDGTWDTMFDEAFNFGMAGDKPVAGAWQGGEIDQVGIFRDGFWWLDRNGDHTAGAGDFAIHFGQAGDTPITGDWNGDGTTDIGVRRGNQFWLDSNGNQKWDAGDQTFAFGRASDKPVVADWNADGKSDVAVYRGNTFWIDSDGNHIFESAHDQTKKFGEVGDTPLAGTFYQEFWIS